MHDSNSGFAEENSEMCQDGSVDWRYNTQNDARIYLHMDSKEQDHADSKAFYSVLILCAEKLFPEGL